MNWNKWVRQSHRWISVAFMVTVIVVFVAVVLGKGQQPPPWLTYSPLPPLFLLMITGVYLLLLPYVSKWRSTWRTKA